MSQQQPKTITCPSCGNINPYTADKCIKCGLALGPIREALEKAGAPAAEEAPSTPPPPVAPSGPPSMPTRAISRIRTEGTRDLGYLHAGTLILIRGMADKVEEVRRLFFQQSEARGISGASYSPGQLEVEGQTRDYQFAERDLGSAAKSTIGVRIAAIGTDLYAEWRHYVLPPKEFSIGLFLLVGGLLSLFGCALLGIAAESGGAATFGALAGLGIGALIASQSRAIKLKGFQGQDAAAFELAIRAALEEAIDLAGIAKELRTETVYESQLPKKKRLI